MRGKAITGSCWERLEVGDRVDYYGNKGIINWEVDLNSACNECSGVTNTSNSIPTPNQAMQRHEYVCFCTDKLSLIIMSN